MRKPIHTWHVSEMTLWYVPNQSYADEGDNKGFPDALALLQAASSRHPEDVRLIDASTLSNEQRGEVYGNHASACSWWGYEVRRVFGTNRHSGWDGTGVSIIVPLLSIRFREFQLRMVAPYIDWQLPSKPTRTILDVLQMLSPSEQERWFGQAVGSDRI